MLCLNSREVAMLYCNVAGPCRGRPLIRGAYTVRDGAVSSYSQREEDGIRTAGYDDTPAILKPFHTNTQTHMTICIYILYIYMYRRYARETASSISLTPYITPASFSQSL